MFHERLRQLRNNKKLTQDTVAKKLGITRSAYSHYERGVREPNYEILLRIEQVLHTSINFLLKGESAH